MKQITFLRCFLTENRVLLDLKHLMEKMTAVAPSTHAWIVVNQKMPT